MTYKIDKLTLLSGMDVPIPTLGLVIHQPTIKEISIVGEADFFMAAETLIMTTDIFLKNSVDTLSEEDKKDISGMSNFQLIMTMIGSQFLLKINFNTLLCILFPNYTINIEDRFILFSKEKDTIIVDENNFSVLQQVVEKILCLSTVNQKEEFNPSGETARMIAEKIKKSREKVARLKGEHKKEASVLSRYISGLSIGTQSLDIFKLLNLTLYQLFDQIERFTLYEQYKISIQAKLAGAKEVENVDWLQDLNR